MVSFPLPQEAIGVRFWCFINGRMTIRAKENKVVKMTTLFFRQGWICPRPGVTRRKNVSHLCNGQELVSRIYKKLFLSTVRILAKPSRGGVKATLGYSVRRRLPPGTTQVAFPSKNIPRICNVYSGGGSIPLIGISYGDPLATNPPPSPIRQWHPMVNKPHKSVLNSTTWD